MFRIPKEWLPIFLILVLCQGTKGLKPEMLPEDPELYINEGASLELNCTSTDEVRFYYPEIKTDADGMLTSPTELNLSPSGHTAIFKRPRAVHGDTGWYGCANQDVNVSVGRYDQPDVNWKYVYVKSNTNWFVRHDIQTSKAVVGKAATIPCRPTSPDYKVVLTSIDTSDDIQLPFDPKIGFIIAKSRLQDEGLYICNITFDDKTQLKHINLQIIKRAVLPEPKIINDTLRHVTKGDKLQVKCTIDVDASLSYHFNWTTPQQDSRIRSNTTSVPTGALTINRATTELTIDGLTYEDQGEYVCTITTHGDGHEYYRKSAKTFITVYNPNITYINLTLEGMDETYEKKIGDEVQWVVSVDAYPSAKLQWLRPNGDPIDASPKRGDDNKEIKISPTSTTLKIKKIHLADNGTYTLQAANENNIETLNITLLVKALPLLDILTTFDQYYMPQQEVEIALKVMASPAPNITCIFISKPNYPSSEGSEEIPLKVSENPKVNTNFVFDVTMTMNASDTGHVICTACNDLGCENAIEPLFVSDVPTGHGIIEHTRELTDGDDLKVTCAASIYNFTNVEWLNQDRRPVRESDRVTITYRQTRFTNRSELHIHQVRNSDNGSYYFCTAMGDNGIAKESDYKLKIDVPQKPYFFGETNMNETVIELDLSTEGHKTFELKCHAKGMPAPNITWYKDDIPIRESEQYIFFDKNQELHIQYLLEENSGKYKCKAENRIGIEEKWMSLVIIGKGIPKVLIYSIVLLIAVCVILVIYFSIKMHREKVMRKQLMEAGLTHFEEGALECLNPELTVDDQAELLPYDKKWEFPRERLKFGKQLGFGAFGVVMKAEARGICDDETVTTVAVKMVRRSTESTYIRALASELKIMVHLGKHLNVVNLLGACTKNITKRELLVIVEYCRFGNLHNYLLRHRADFINQIDSVSGKIDPTIGLDKLTRTTSVGSNNRLKYTVLSFSRSLSANSSNSNPGAELVSYTAGTDSQSVSMSPDGCVLSNNSTQPGWRSNYSGDYKDQNLKPICTQDLLSWAFQVARGMEYLSQRKVLHGDLAARNILLAENNVVKICDFGLAKTMYKDDNYKKKGDAPLPIKWMAIESIRDRVFSTQSDIWSFGIVLWEFFTLAKTPYPGMEAEKQYQRLIEGYRMEQPEYATDDVYDIMLQCWKAKPTLRPTFTNLVANIGDLLEEGVKEHYVDLNAPYLNMNTMVLESGKNDYLTMMSAPDHDALSSPTSLYVNTPCHSPPGTQDNSYLAMSPSSPGNESGIFSPRAISNNSKFEFPMNDMSANVNSDSESEAVEIDPMLAQEEDNYLKPINVHERRAEFARQRQAQKAAAKMEKDNESDSGYCNTPRNLHPIDLNDANLNRSQVDGIKRAEEKYSATRAKDYVPPIIRTQDNYVNMPKQKDNLRKDAPVSFSNPSYVMMGNRNFEQAKV